MTPRRSNHSVGPGNEVENSSFGHDVILSHWAPSWLTLQITLAVYSEIVLSIYYFIVSLSVLWMLILRSVAQ